MIEVGVDGHRPTLLGVHCLGLEVGRFISFIRIEMVVGVAVRSQG